jgi:hypothetical protein
MARFDLAAGCLTDSHAGVCIYTCRIEAAFEIAVLPDEDGNVREQKPAWLRFLRECEARGVLLPKGAFAVSKMMDSIISQQVTYGLPPVLGAFLAVLHTHTHTLSLSLFSLLFLGAVLSFCSFFSFHSILSSLRSDQGGCGCGFR